MSMTCCSHISHLAVRTYNYLQHIAKYSGSAEQLMDVNNMQVTLLSAENTVHVQNSSSDETHS